MKFYLVTSLLFSIFAHPGDAWIGVNIGSYSDGCYYKSYTGLVGKLDSKKDTLTLMGSGVGLNGNVSQFYYGYKPIRGSFQAQGTLVRLEQTHNKSISGLMVRNTTHSKDDFWLMGIDAENNAIISKQDRNGFVLNKIKKVILPIEIKVIRSGNNMRGFIREIKTSTIDSIDIDISFDSTLLVGFAISSGKRDALSKTSYTNCFWVKTEDVAVDSSGYRKFRFNEIDVGEPILKGAYSENSGQHVIKGSGWEIGGSGDSFHFAFQKVSSMESSIIRVLSLDSANDWSSAGIMVRTSLKSNSPFVYLAVTPGFGAIIKCRLQKKSNRRSTFYDGQLLQIPRWLKLSRTGNTYKGEASSDGTKWNTLGQFEVDLGDSVFVGLAASSINPKVLVSAKIDNAKFKIDR